MRIKAERDKYLGKIKVEEWNTILELTFDDLDAYELVQLAQTIIYQKETHDWEEAKQRIMESM